MENTKLIFGNRINSGYQYKDQDYRVFYQDAERSEQYYFTLNDSIMSRHILLLGGAGTGKTNVFNLTVNQLRQQQDSNDVFIVFDTKGDFYNNFGRPEDHVLGNSRAFRSMSARWNIFEEIMADGDAPEDYMINAREISAALFSDRGSSAQPFFVNAARDIFAQTLIYFVRRAKENPTEWNRHLNNKSVVGFLLKAGGTEYIKMFTRYSDMKGVLAYIGDGSSNQALGVFGELKGMLYDCFMGVFSDDDRQGRFSMRRAVRKKGGKAIFIEYDLMTGETLTPIYRLLIDLALKEALGRSESEHGNVYLILDELKLLPKLRHLDDALNFGRSMGVKVIAGIQTINQLYDIYGEAKGHVLAGGFSTIYAFHTSDSASREYVTSLFGRNVIGYQYTGMDMTIEKREREGNTVESWDQLDLQIGEAIIGLADVPVPFYFRFPEYK